jgi:hypothetical protein
MENYNVYKRLKILMGKITDEDALENLIKSSKTTLSLSSPRLGRIFELEAEIRLLQLRYLKAESVSERYRIHREITRLRSLIYREKLHEKAKWNYMVQATKYRLLNAKYFIKDVENAVENAVNGVSRFRRWFIDCLPPSFKYLGSWALTSREIVVWSQRRAKRPEKPKLR